MLDTKTPMKVFIGSAFPPPEKIDRTEEEVLRLQIADLNDQIKSLNRVKRSQFLPYEAKAVLQKVKAKQGVIRSEIARIYYHLGKIEKRVRLQEMHIYMAQNGYPEQLDLAPLAISNEDGDPAFMVSPVDNRSGVCQIRARYSPILETWVTTVEPKLPKPIADQLLKNFHRNVRASFGGYTENQQVRKEIERAKRSGLFDQILVIAEVAKWEVIDGDPIIAGWVKETEQLFFITAYDMTPLEEYFHSQFGFGVTMPEK